MNNSTGRLVSATYRFVVTKSWRGELTDTITLKTGASNCHVLLKNRRQYILYLHPDSEVSICNRIVERRGKLRAEVKKLNAYFSGTPK